MSEAAPAVSWSLREGLSAATVKIFVNGPMRRL